MPAPIYSLMLSNRNPGSIITEGLCHDLKNGTFNQQPRVKEPVAAYLRQRRCRNALTLPLRQSGLGVQ